MDTLPRIIGSHAFFIREGAAFTSPSAGTVSKTSKPDENETTWIDLGTIESASIEHSSDEKEVWKPSPGQLRLDDVLENKRALSFDVTVNEVSPFAFQLLFGTDDLTSASTQYNPLEGTTVKGWMKMQQYDHEDNIWNTVDVYVHLKINGAVEFGEDVVKFPIRARVLHSTLNTGTLA